MSDSKSERASLMSEVQAAFEQLRPKTQGSFPQGDWITRYFDSTALDALEEREPAHLAQIVLSHMALGQTRAPADIAIRVTSPDAEASDSPLAQLQVCVEDMPFLVDTLLIAVRQAGAALDWTAHPIVRLERDIDSQLLGLKDSENSVSEAWIHLEFEPLESEPEYAALEASVAEHLADLRMVIADQDQMRGRIQSAIKSLTGVPAPTDALRLERIEAAEFLRWLGDGHFTILASAETRFQIDADGRARSIPDPSAALGLARAGARFADIDALVAPREELDKYAESPRVVVLTKAALQATVHRPEYMDHIAVRYFGEDGKVAGILRLIGLYASDAYVERPWDIPLIRRRVESVMQRSRLLAGSHSAKNLREILHSLPRDELFQFGENELFETCMGISALRDRHPLKLFLRRDRYGRFFSALVYLPRERFSRELRDQVVGELLAVCNGRSAERNVDFLRGGMTRVHVVVHTAPGSDLNLSESEIEARLRDIARPWRDQLTMALRNCGVAGAEALGRQFGEAFATSYTERVSADEAARDVLQLKQLDEAMPLLPTLELEGDGCGRLKLYAWAEPQALAEILPVLENFGVRAIRQDPEPVTLRQRSLGRTTTLWIQDFEVELPIGEGEDRKVDFEAALLAVLQQKAEDDAMNRLVLAAGLDGRQVVAIRMLAKYVNQIGLPYGRADIDRKIAFNPQVAAQIVAYFEARFDPKVADSDRGILQASRLREIESAINDIENLDTDRILRALLSVVSAGLRTNFYQNNEDGAPKQVISLKLDPSRIPELPRPRPMFEIWVYSLRMEGVHLRGGRVSRGGLRWSDRHEDFRTEVLGLMKAQQVKNAVIIPVGAKGGFVVKRGPSPSDREAWLEDGRACYRNFLRGLLDITDNRDGDLIVPPKQVVRHDEDDPYLVVAADKGTATFSDIANDIAQDYGFWLGDAFASGGSAGYDHKKMGITARGGWESVKRHFRELGKDIQSEPFTVVGIGDMSGDVFGNGMLLSKHIHLLAAFDHRHIFIDPEPGDAGSYEERKRLFGLGRSSWEDYKPDLISKGGGVYSRKSKSIKLSEQARMALGTDKEEVPPNELIQIVLKAPVDLLWNGGVGTYVKAASQSQEQVRDRANDAVRVNGRDVRARVIGEGGNLGLTQAGRIEFALHGAGGEGGRINTDAIDNSGGVHSSDREVNIKIPLNLLLRDGSLQIDDRNQLLESMSDELIEAVLSDNQIQSGCISLVESEAALRLDEHAALIRSFEREGRLDRALEGLPDDEQIQDRRSQGLGLQRPEIAVLVAYSKIALFEAALDSEVVDDAFFTDDLLAYFPKALVKRFRAALENHGLRREIISTICANSVVNRMGPSAARRLAEDHGVPLSLIIQAYKAAEMLFDGSAYWEAIEALDHRIPSAQQYRLMQQVCALLRHVMTVIISNRALETMSINDLRLRYQDAVANMTEKLPEVLPGAYREDYDNHYQQLLTGAVPEGVAKMITQSRALGSVLDIADLAREAELSLEKTLPVYFAVGEFLHLPWMLSAIIRLKPNDVWQALARSRLREDAYRLHRLICARVLACSDKPPEYRLEAWRAPRAQRLKLSLTRLSDLQSAVSADYAGLAVAVRELHDLQAL